MQNSEPHRKQKLAMWIGMAIMFTLVGTTPFVPTASLIGIVLMNGVFLLIFAWILSPTTVKTGDKNTEDTTSRIVSKEGSKR